MASNFKDGVYTPDNMPSSSSVGIFDATSSCSAAKHDDNCKSAGVTIAVEEITNEFDAQALSRQRPGVFPSAWREIAFVSSMLVSLAMADFFIGGFQTVLPPLMEPLHIPETSKTWPTSVVTLVAGSFILPCGRLADMFGGYIVFHVGIIWFIIWAVIGGFSNGFIMLVLCRAMQGLGASLFLPAGVSLLGRIYHPGPRKNFIFSLYAAITPIGFFTGIMVGGMSSQLMTWNWYFWLGAILTTLCCIGSLLTSPCDYTSVRSRGVTMDWWGVSTMVPGFILFIYAITDSRQAVKGWSSPHIIVCFILGVLFLGAAVYVEGWKATSPLFPPEIFQVKFMKRMILTLFLTWGVYALFLFYANFYISTILHKTSIITAVWFAPWAAGGIVLSISSGLILHILPNRVLLVGSLVFKIIAVLFFALMPVKPNYWAWVFPSMVAEAASVDVLWTVSNVFLTTNLPGHLQGFAGALIYITVYIGSAFFLAIAGVVVGRFKSMGMAPKAQYKGIFWMGVGIAAVALVLCFFMDLGTAGHESPGGGRADEADSGCEAALDSSSMGDRLGVTNELAATPHASRAG